MRMNGEHVEKYTGFITAQKNFILEYVVPTGKIFQQFRHSLTLFHLGIGIIEIANGNDKKFDIVFEEDRKVVFDFHGQFVETNMFSVRPIEEDFSGILYAHENGGFFHIFKNEKEMFHYGIMVLKFAYNLCSYEESSKCKLGQVI